MGVRPSSVDSQHPASCRMCPYIGFPCVSLYTLSTCNFYPRLRGSSYKTFLSGSHNSAGRSVPCENSPSGRRDGISSLGKCAIFTVIEGKTALQLRSQRLRRDHRVDHQLGGQMEHVDVLRVLRPLVLDESLPLPGIFDCLDLVVED